MVIGTLLMLLELEFLEHYLDSVAVDSGEVPDAVLAAGVEIRPVGAADLTLGRVYLVLATA